MIIGVIVRFLYLDISSSHSLPAALGITRDVIRKQKVAMMVDDYILLERGWLQVIGGSAKHDPDHSSVSRYIRTWLC
jgi:hypothetical protein